MAAHFEQGTDRGGFKTALLKAFKSAHKAAQFPPSNIQAKPKLPQGQGADARGMTVGGHQANKMPTSNAGENVLNGGPHASPAMTARGPVNHNNDPRRTGFQVAGHQASKIQLTPGAATNSHTLLPKGHQANKIKVPQGMNSDTRSLRGR
jgi:hypothetical protein